ncbi:RHS repeat-associated protein [Flavobacterium sp. 90]|uniref:DUF6443 domain-containing protein n=1 Tax=unclassified Flavobacterium TaxID=196869 RepID=UPI000EB2EF8C|nr:MULTISPECIES: DUF6443 domain-containing protein [unclassified Flavobacterium]RKR09236.1 RHS repeat-associated protein [Flavobacterium sp. 81]TCK53020.1 RHS repeat-associated protein [Flavobacterium sp. 90]
MKKYIAIIILLLLAIPGINAQTFSDDNFVYKIAPKKKVQASDFSTLTKDSIVQNITYFDGLGRPVQSMAIGQGVGGTDIVTPIQYDGFGRQVKEYLPYPVANSGTNYPRIDTEISIESLKGVYSSKFDDASNPFSEKQLESSPLSRVLKQAAPGDAWAMNSGHEIKFDYQTNTGTTEVKLYKATANWDAGLGLYDIRFVDAGNYGINELYKTVTYDENTTPGTKVGIEEFKNKQGQVVLKRNYNGTDQLDTYYVYDIYGNLTYVIPPKADAVIDREVLDGLCYQYKYDYRNRLVEKKLPGKDWEFIVYDNLNRPVATGPAASPFKDDATIGWIITKYDVLGRPIYTGWSSDASNSTMRKTLQDAQNLATTLFETKTALNIDSIPTGYNNSIAPTNFKLLTVNYYDDYSFPAAQAVPTTIMGQKVLTNVKGLPTGSWTRVITTLTSDAGETATVFYDKTGKVISTYLKNYLGGINHSDSKLDFLGKPLSTVTEHQRLSSGATILINEKFTYSAQDRLLTHTHQIGNGGTEELMASNEYDELGQLKSKSVGNSALSPLQKVDFAYNIRGWLTDINDTKDLNQDLFAFRINYNKVEGNTSYTKELYNGNIAETFWSSGLDASGIKHGYGYQYDQLNRLKDAWYQDPKSADNKNYFGENNIEYDKNGNITKLLRERKLGTANPYVDPMDNLDYFYKANTNRLMKVTDKSNAPEGFKDDSNGSNDTVDDYDYDLNGNLIKDDNKGITKIEYNHLNLPKKIAFGITNNIEYIYNATGQKVQKIVTETGKPTLTTDYLGGFQYKNNDLEFFPTAEGYVKSTSGNLSYVFQYKDHLGNVRVSYTKNSSNVPEVIDENNYYPFGLTHVSNSILPGTNNKYKFNGKELQDETIGGNQLNLYDYGARNYDPALGRWMNIDPLAEISRRNSPYVYALNNPVYFIDPDGMANASNRGSGNGTDEFDKGGKKEPMELYPGQNNTNNGKYRDDDPNLDHKVSEFLDDFNLQPNYIAGEGGKNGEGGKGAKGGKGGKGGKRGQKTSKKNVKSSYSLSDLWNSAIARVLVPDQISLHLTQGVSGAVGFSQDHAWTWITRGNDASLTPYRTVTLALTAGADFSANFASVGIGSGRYLTADMRNLEPGTASGGLLGWGGNLSGDLGLGVGGSVNGSIGFSEEPLVSRPTWVTTGFSGGFTSGAGVRGGISYTIPINR